MILPQEYLQFQICGQKQLNPTVSFMQDYLQTIPALAALRDSYSIPENSLKDPARVPLLNSFFFWIILGMCYRSSRPGNYLYK